MPPALGRNFDPYAEGIWWPQARLGVVSAVGAEGYSGRWRIVEQWSMQVLRNGQGFRCSHAVWSVGFISVQRPRMRGSRASRNPSPI